MKVVLMGNPNVGKSVIFSRLTGADVIVANYPGTTVDFTKGRMKIDGKMVEVIDAPGTYSLTPSNKAEEIARKLFDESDLIINVVDATNLERNLFLTLELIEYNKPVIVALNLWDEATHKGIKIDEKQIEDILGIPVIPTVALTGEGIKELVDRLKDVKPSRKVSLKSDEERWKKIGDITKRVQKIEHKHHSWKDIFSELSIKPATGIPIAIIIIFFSFWVVRIIGETLIAYIFEPLFEIYKPLAMKISDLLGGGILNDILIGKLIEGEIEYSTSMGILTTGLFIPFGVVLPYIVAFYLFLGILEDVGYLPRLSTLVDNLFHRLGMHGAGVIPLFLGLGCNVAGSLSSRILETRKQRFISATLLAIAVPCMAQISMIFGILGPYGVRYIATVFFVLSLIYIVGGLILNKFVKGESPEIFIEIPPYRLPSIKALLKKLWMRIRWFLRDAIPWLFLGVLTVNIFYSLGFIDLMAKIFSPAMQYLFGLPGEATIALLIGFLRKDLAVGMLLPLGLNAVQLTISATILAIYFPCVATFVVLLKELGWKDTIKSTIIMLFTAINVGFIMKTILI